MFVNLIRNVLKRPSSNSFIPIIVSEIACKALSVEVTAWDVYVKVSPFAKSLSIVSTTLTFESGSSSSILTEFTTTGLLTAGSGPLVPVIIQEDASMPPPMVTLAGGQRSEKSNVNSMLPGEQTHISVPNIFCDVLIGKPSNGNNKVINL